MRNRNRDVKIYEIDIDGNTAQSAQSDNARLVSSQDVANDSNEYDRKEEIIRQYNENMSREHEVAIRTNPFMFRTNEEDKWNVHSIEDFTVKVKRKEERSIKQVLRTNEYRPAKKKKIIIGAIINGKIVRKTK